MHLTQRAVKTTGSWQKIWPLDGVWKADLMAKKKARLPRGLEDLLEQNQDDLPFLDSYGPAEEEGDWAKGVIDSTAEKGTKKPTKKATKKTSKKSTENGDSESNDFGAGDGAEMLDALARHIRSLTSNCEELVPAVELDSLTLGIYLEAKLTSKTATSLSLTFNSPEPLPLVASDLIAAGLSDGNLAVNRLEASCTIDEWGIAGRRLIERLIEHWISIS
jgi:hypothetical protein